MALNPLIALAAADTPGPFASYRAGQRMKEERADRERQRTLTDLNIEQAQQEAREYKAAAPDRDLARMSERDQLRLQRSVMAAAELDSYLQSGDTAGAQKFLESRKADIEGIRQRYPGIPIDTNETDAALQMLNAGQVDELKQLTGKSIELGKQRGWLTGDGEQYTLKPGERRFGADGRELASVAPESKILSPEEEAQKIRIAAASRSDPREPAPTVTEIVRDGKVIKIDAKTGREIGEAPTSGKGKAMSVTAQKELFEAEDMMASSQNAIDILQSILVPDLKSGKSQNETAYEGKFPEARLWASRVLPGSTEATDASVDLKNKVQGQALESLKATFGGMPTEGERKILIELQGSLDMTAKQREAVFKRAINLAKRRMEFNRKKAEQLRAGEYFSEQDGGGSSDTPPDTSDVVDVNWGDLD